MPPRGGKPGRSGRGGGPLLPFDSGAGAPPAGAAVPTSEGAPRRVFLGWERPVLHSAARWIGAELGSELGDVLVAVPGARAARRLRELLAEGAPPAWLPPRVLTQGELVDELVLLERPPAGRLTRTLVWERALERLAPDELARLNRARAMDGAEERLRLAETVRRLHGELAPEGRDFATLAREPWAPGLEAEEGRWGALGTAQQHYRELLATLGRVDPHEGRARAIAEGRIERSRRVVLVAVADMTHLLARLVAALGARVTVLVGAPEDLAEGFDALGRLRPALWSARDVPLALADWRVAEKPVDQAEAVRTLLDEWRGTLAPEELTLGVADESLLPYLERQLAECGATARHAAGTPLEHARPYRLLRALARFLRRRGFAELAALARDTDLASALAPGADPAASFDAYFDEHLPRLARGWIEAHAPGRAVHAFDERLRQALGALADEARRPLAQWAEPIRGFLGRVHPRPLAETSENDRVLAEALRGVAGALAEMEDVPAALELAGVTAAEALELLLRALRGQRVAPPPVPAPGTVELVGWLDLALDDAPAVILTGFNEGQIPRSLGGDAFLPDGLRTRLGLPGDAERLARDAYAATLVLATRARRAFVSGRRSREGDPLVPSRLAFHRPEAEIPARVAHFLPGREEPGPRVDEEGAGPDHACPLPPGWTAPTRLSVSAFRAFLASPYVFYLEQVLKLRTLDDRTRELDPLRFGTFAHAVLQDFGTHGPHASADPEEVADFLVAAVRRRAAAEFGPAPLPAVGLQLAQLEHRLRVFAAHQAARAADGWRIHAVEWKPSTPVWLDVDGVPLELAAKIDRVDHHADGRWAVLDYKTGEAKRNPRDAHRRRDGTWVDLQLPLYRLASAGLGLEGEPELGYAWIGKDEAETGFFVEPWSPAELEEALEVARTVVRRVRAGEFRSVGRLPYDEILQALCGASTLGTTPGERPE